MKSALQIQISYIQFSSIIIKKYNKQIITKMLINLLTKIQHNFLKSKPNKKAQVLFKNWSIVRGDTVQVRTGKDRGKVGKVLRVFRKANFIIVQGVNLRTKRFRTEAETLATRADPCKIHVSNVGIYDSVAKRAVRIKYGYHPQTYQKLRISKKTGIILPKPNRDDVSRQARGKDKKKGIKDTAFDIAHKVTYQGQNFKKIKQQFEAFIAEKEKREKNLVFTY